MKRSAKTSSLIPESSTIAGRGDGPACARHLQHHWRRHRRRPHRHQFRNDLKAYRDDKQMTSAVCSLSTVKGIQQISRSRQHSRRRSGAPKIDQIADTNRSRRGVGAQLYIPRLLEIVERRPVYVRLALWFLHHPTWMESHTGGSRFTTHSYCAQFNWGGCGWPT